MIVGTIAKIIKTKAPKNFPFTMSQFESGLVNNNSIVPCFFSSEKLRMVTAGIKKIKIHGANLKNGLISAKPEFKMLNSPSKTQRNNPLSKRKIPMTKYPIGEPKKDFISRNNNAFIFYCLTVETFICLTVLF